MFFSHRSNAIREKEHVLSFILFLVLADFIGQFTKMKIRTNIELVNLRLTSPETLVLIPLLQMKEEKILCSYAEIRLESEYNPNQMELILKV